MKKILISIAAVSALAAATVPGAVMAQPLHQRDNIIASRIEQGQRSGDLTRREAARLRGELRETVRLQHRYSRDGLNGRERADLDRRFDRISAQVRYERRDNQYGSGYGPHRPNRY